MPSRRSFISTLIPAAAAAMLPGAAVQAGQKAAASGPQQWQVTIAQIDPAGTMVGELHAVSCPRGGCQTMLPLDIAGRSHRFLAVISFVRDGAYVVLQATEPQIGRVVEFDKGFTGPNFVPLRSAGRGAATLNFTLTGAAIPESNHGLPPLMQNSQSLVFHRKMEPDLTLRIELTPSTAPS